MRFFCKLDFILESTRVPEVRQIKQHSAKALSKETNESIWNGFLNLNEQSGIIRSLVEQFPASSLISWQNVISKLPDNIIKFSRRYLIYSLSNGTNLQKWKQNDSPNCLLCNKKETQLHLFNNCEAALKRYEWRHNSIVGTIMNNLIMSTSKGFKLYADINGFENTNILFKSSRPNEVNAEMYRQRPDIVILEKRRITIIELTCPYETNFDESHEFKARRYSNLRNALITPRAQFNLILLKISTLGFVGKTIKIFGKFLKELKLDDKRIINKCQEVAIRTSYYIYCRRRKEWTDPEIILYT